MRGRPKLVHIPSALETIEGVIQGPIFKYSEPVLEYVQPHIHVLIFAYPSHMLAELIRKYLYKVLNEVDVNDELMDIKLIYQVII